MCIETNLKNLLAELAVDQFRFLQSLDKVMNSLDYEERERLLRQIRWQQNNIEKILSRAGMSIMNPSGHPYDPGYPVTALNIKKGSDGIGLEITNVLEPAIISNSEIIHRGIVVLEEE